MSNLLDKLNDSVILSFDPGMLYVKKGVNGLRKILQRTNILLINKNELMDKLNKYALKKDYKVAVLGKKWFLWIEIFKFRNTRN